KSQSEPQWSPDGKQIAFCALREGDSDAQVYVIDVAGGEARRLSNTFSGLSALRWCPDGKSLIAIQWRWPELAGEVAQAKNKKDRAALKTSPHVTESAVYRYWDHWLTDGRVPQLVRVRMNGKVEPLMNKAQFLPLTEPSRLDYALAPDGMAVAYVQPRNRDSMLDPCDIIWLDLRTKKAVAISPTEGAFSCASPSISPDGTLIAYTQSQPRDITHNAQLQVYSRKHKTHQRLAAGWDRSFGTYGHFHSSWQGNDALIFTAEDMGRSNLYRLLLDAETPEVLLKGGSVESFSHNHYGLLATVASMKHPSQLFAVTPKGVRRLDAFNQFLNTKTLGEVEELTLPGYADEPVHAWVCYPPNYQKGQRYPLLQNIHGGPHAAHLDTWHYRWNAQAFAAQGYVVVMVNYHGSSSYGDAFIGSIDGSLGKREYADIEAFSDHFVNKKIADKNRLFAAGGSYGGYMVAYMNGQAKKPRYRAMVCHAGVYDWFGQFSDDCAEFWRYELGTDIWDNLPHIQTQNPAAFAANFNTPTLVIHGELDYRVPYYQGLQYYNTLKVKGVPSRLLVYADENHWILKPQNSRQWYTEFFAWLRRFDTATA
ncbi:MAG: Dipeptidyl-peptidase 5, partial [Pseudomonadota bacterium]